MGLWKTMITNTAIKTAGKVIVGTTTGVTNTLAKNGIVMITLRKDADDFIGADYKDVENEFIAYGFSSVGLIPQRDLVWGLTSRFYGKVAEVSINGKTNFKRKQTVRSDAKIAIVYHAHKNKKRDPIE